MTTLAIAALVASNAVAAKYDVAAYVWPAYQPEPRWSELGIFKAGKGEWQNVWEAVPKWEGHVQPLKPLWGYENEADPKVVEKKIDAAVSHGVNVFIYDWYWYGGRPFLEDALNKGFLGAKNNGKMKFFVMWANHHVNWLWDNTTADKRWGAPRKDWLGFVTDEEFRTKLVPRWISQYFGRSNYYRIGGKPVLMIYEVGTFVQGVGGVEKAAAAIAFLRAEAVKAGFGGVHLMACDFGVKPEWVKALGIDSASIYNFVHWSNPSGNPDYADWAKRGADRFDAAKRELGLAAYFPHASVGWDTNPRYPKGSVQPTAINSTPAKFEQVLRRAKAWSDANPQPGMPKLITVNSWNEWTEGSYLEPDTINEFGYLEAVRRVVEWDLEMLGEAPRTSEPGTYLALPKVASGKKVPGMVFAHAGQDDESVRWAKFWSEKGYAAIAVKAKGDASQDVAAVIRANSYLRSLPEVDGERIGLTGVARGGVTACIAASVDSRFNFVAPISGCGYLDGDDALDPRHYLADAKVPFFWIAGTNDREFPLPSLQKSVATPGTPYYRSTRVGRALDSATALACSQELVDFAAFQLKPEGNARTSYPFMHDCRESGGEVWAICTPGNDDGVAHAELNWTADRGAWDTRKWTSLKMNPVGDGTTATVDLPDDASAWYVSFFMKDGKCVSGELFERTSEDAAALRQLRAAFAKDGRFQADFSQKARDIRPALHSSGWSPRLYPRKLVNDDAAVKALRMTYTRTHDWALVNSGQRVVDTCRIFPLMHLDPKDPKNYVFGPTDEALKLARNVGLKIMYRLGESIEHTDGVHFNVLVPDDYEKYAEVMAGIVRHYNRGWANGYHWNIEYWNFWEEPDGISNLWCLPGKEGQDAMAMRKRFIRLFVTVMKRLKSEFPEIKFGGPALIGCNLSYFRDLVEACRAEGLKPDFISWDHYGHLPDRIFDDGRAARKLLDELDCPKTEIVLAEWHYLLTWTGIHGNNPTPEQVRAAKYGPTGVNQIDSACYALTVLSRFQFSEFDQAYYYGCSHVGSWGYLDEDKAFNKPYRALCAFGNIVGDHAELCEAKSGRRSVTVLAARSADGARKTLLVTDYRGTEMSFEVSVKGIPAGAKARVRRLDQNHADWVEVPSVWNGEKLTLKKETSGSAAFLVNFDKKK